MHILEYLPKLFLGYLFVVISALGFSISSILVKLAYNYDVTPAQLLTMQNLFATLILWLLAFVFQPTAFHSHYFIFYLSLPYFFRYFVTLLS